MAYSISHLPRIPLSQFRPTVPRKHFFALLHERVLLLINVLFRQPSSVWTCRGAYSAPRALSREKGDKEVNEMDREGEDENHAPIK